jgi:hypothetical protein
MKPYKPTLDDENECTTATAIILVRCPYIRKQVSQTRKKNYCMENVLKVNTRCYGKRLKEQGAHTY